MEARDIILKPLITEKSVAKMSEGKYAFKVRLDANKTQIKQAIEEIFGVTVVRVNTMRVRGKLRRQGKYIGRRSDWKKAIVQLKEGDSIKVFEGL
ncbi:MAG: 50S ribosomal protein L23 [Symbiobacterium thermophilum]|uniref:Large ribosomal subunit protein uL23 n=4 Tax=Symbiobacterium thermophilum TaxID=2734 RepID=RL23_SYMTH|nr:RecName: Full=Large ribosomal subunit protein uL23; AltName: Full=50S ribosomal protein L23 [Symbiobacterium thermophilum IAM 14863]MBY6274756.1 50S ribosomal protein L23 [Symbiobacterium thermophilum]OTA40213.1 MAG: 50S ribosomal protein L23 [Symbiobacterium thermophilum]BAD42055.1 50S ribosomal protein L23 [Symbiobacterium thermophilum IAM 14863]